MKKTILLAAGALAFLLSPVKAQEADRFVGCQHVKFQTACHPQDVKGYDTKMLRNRFVMEKVMSPDSILLTYSHYDRFIFGGVMPVTKTLKLENFWELGLDVDKNIKEKYFMYNRQLGVVPAEKATVWSSLMARSMPSHPKRPSISAVVILARTRKATPSTATKRYSSVQRMRRSQQSSTLTLPPPTSTIRHSG